ncbi:MAG: DUF4280 domain-containing protein [Prevotella sp.]|nr:DUF4280 domain-containing protein [Prevotella sp.]
MGDSYVVTGAIMACTFGMAPSSFMASPGRTEMLSNVPKGNIMDFAPMVNIMPFGMCNTLSNPTVAAATSAAMGVLTPMPCIPAITTPWMPGNPQVMVQGQPALMRSCRNMCMWGGQISFTTDGQMPCPPPVIIPPINVPFPDLQPDWMLTNLESHEIWQYKHDFEDAKHAGDGDRAIAENLKEMSARYAAQGEFDKATQAMQASEQYRNRADQKQAAAMYAVNDKYVWGTPTKEQPAEMSREDLQDVHDQAKKEQAQYDKEIGQLDKQIANDEAALMKESEDLAKVSRKQSSANQELKDAKQEKTDAAAKRKAAEKEAKEAAWNEQSAKERGDKEAAQYFHNQKKEAEKTAKKAAKEEKAADEKVAKAQKEYDAVSKEQSKAYNDFRDHVDQHKELKEQKQTAEDNRAAAEQKANTAQMAMDAQDTLDKHQEAINAHEASKAETREKREEVNALKKEEQINRDEADAWVHAGQWNKEHGHEDTAAKIFEKSAEYDDKADAAREQWIAKEKEYNDAKAAMSETRKQAYGDDAMFDAYTAELQLGGAMNYLKNNPSGNTGTSSEDNEKTSNQGSSKGKNKK